MSTLKRSRRRELVLTPSFTNVIKSKITSIAHSRRPSKSSLTDNGSIITEVSQINRTIRPIRTMSPVHIIHCLPPEVLSLIFVLGSSGEDERSIVFPVVVSHICGAWRDLAFATHSLWCRIIPDTRWRMWKQFLGRSGSCLLDVMLFRHCFLDAGSVQWRMHLVAPHIRRWRSFVVQFDHYAPFLWNAALSSCCGTSTSAHALNLERLTLVYPRNDDTKEFTLFGGVAPRLRRLTLDGLRLDWLPSLFQNLTFLDYTHHGFTQDHDAVMEILSMLQTSFQIQDLRLSFSVSAREEGYFCPLPVVTMHQLSHMCLRVRNDIPAEMTVLMGCLQTPALQTLHLRDASCSKHAFPSLKSFSKSLRHARSLKVLDVEYGWWEKRFIATFGGITRLVVNGSERWRQC